MSIEEGKDGEAVQAREGWEEADCVNVLRLGKAVDLEGM